MRNSERGKLLERHAANLARGASLCVGDGWVDTIDRALRRIATAMTEEPKQAVVLILRANEEHGLLRLYYDANKLSAASMKAVEAAIELAQARSACTCEICGEEGRLYDCCGLSLTRCTRHAEGELVPVRQGWTNLRIVRTVHPGGLRVDSCRRYDRRRDRFVQARLPEGWDEE